MRGFFGEEAAGAAVSGGGKGPGKRTGHLESEGLLGRPGGWTIGLVWQRMCLVSGCHLCIGSSTQQVFNRWGAEKGAGLRGDLGWLGQPHTACGSLEILG